MLRVHVGRGVTRQLVGGVPEPDEDHADQEHRQRRRQHGGRRHDGPGDPDGVTRGETIPPPATDHERGEGDRPGRGAEDDRRAWHAAPDRGPAQVLGDDRGDRDGSDMPGAAEGDAADERPRRAPSRSLEIRASERHGVGHRTAMIGRRSQSKPSVSTSIPPRAPRSCSAAVSTSRQRASTSRICPGVRQLASRSAGLATTIATALARDIGDVEAIPAVQELHVPRGIVLARARHGVDRHGAFLPLELVDRADRHARARSGRASTAMAIAATWALYGATTRMSRQTESARRAVGVGPGPADQPGDRVRHVRRLLGRRGRVALVDERREADAGTVQLRVAGTDGLPRRRRVGGQASVVERLRDVAVDRRVHPPGRLEEQPAGVVDRRRTAQQVLESRGAGAFGMHALADLGQLVGIAEQHDGPRGTCSWRRRSPGTSVPPRR